MDIKQFFSKTESAEVQRYIPLHRTLIRICVALLLIIFPTISFFIGEVVGNINKGKQLAEQQQLFDLSESLDEDLRKTTNQLNQAQTQLDISKETIESLRLDILEWRKNYEGLSESINRYREVIATGTGARSIVVERAQIYTDTDKNIEVPNENFFILKSSVVQYTLSKERFIGKMSIAIEGYDNNKKVTIEHKDLFEDPFKPLDFYYFQHNDLYFALPDTFNPRVLKVFIDGTSIQGLIIEKYRWSSILIDPQTGSCTPQNT